MTMRLPAVGVTKKAFGDLFESLRGASVKRMVVVYAIVAALTIALFIALHVAGNRLPYDLAVERLAEEFHATHGEDWGMRGGVWQDKWHYCEFSVTVLAGARATRDGGGLREAIMLRSIPSRDECDNLKAAVFQGAWFEQVTYANPRHWMGGKAIYAIALRYLTVRQFYIVIEALIYCGFIGLMFALYLVGWRTLLVGAPLLVFGIFGCGLEHYNIGDGLPFAWAFFSAALGVVLLRRGPPMIAARLFFFFAGMVSHYFWFFDGGNFIAATLIGLVAWLVPNTDSPRQRIGWAAACVSIYISGFAVSLASRVVLVSAISEGGFERWFARRTGDLLERISTPLASDLAARDFGTYQMLGRIDAPTLDWLLITSATALVLAATIGGHRAWKRCNRGSLVEVLWLGVLFLPSVVHFLLPVDAPLRAARLMFLPLGLSWCCLLALLATLPRRKIVAWGGGIGLALTLSYGAMHFANQQEHEGKLANARLLSASQEGGRFALHLVDVQGKIGEDSNRPAAADKRELIYSKSPCSAKDLWAPSHLHVLAPIASLPARWRQLGYVNMDFSFYANGQAFLGTCYASVRLPDYAKGIRTGQSVYVGGTHGYTVLWKLEIDLTPHALTVLNSRSSALSDVRQIVGQ